MPSLQKEALEGLESIPREISSENKYSSGGLPVCRLCGEIHADISSHIQEAHHMSPDKYLLQYPGWPLQPRNDSTLGALTYKDREQEEFSVHDTFHFWWSNGKKDKKVIGYKENGPLTPKIDPNYVFNPEYTSVALLGLHLKDKVLTYGPTGCHAAGTPILMFDGTFKHVEDIIEGDQIMGMDSTVRSVLELHRGQDQLVDIVLENGDSFRVNRGHILSGIFCDEADVNKPYSISELFEKMINVSVEEFLTWDNAQQQSFMMVQVGVEFPTNTQELYFDPYVLGVLLGSGYLTGAEPVIDNSAHTIRQEIQNFTKKKGLQAVCEGKYRMTLVDQQLSEAINNESSLPYNGSAFHLKGGAKNTIKEQLNLLGLWGCLEKDKFIPHQYKRTSHNNRLEILAGLLDTKAFVRSTKYRFVTVSSSLAHDVYFLAKSLGLQARYTKDSRYTEEGIEGICYEVEIKGSIAQIPCRVISNRIVKNTNTSCATLLSFTIKDTGKVDTYYGFSVDQDNRYLLGDFTITHNSGKTTLWEQIAARLRYNFVRINFDAGITRADLVGQWIVKGREMYFSYGILPSAMVLPGTIICFDEWDTVSEECSFVLQRPLEQHSQLLILEHGEQVITLHKDNLIVATANTAGMGDDSGLYSAGTRLQNFSQINRFSLTIELNYLPSAEEQKILKNRFGTLESVEAEFMVQITNGIREAFVRGEIASPLSTRDLINWAEKYVIWGDIEKAAKYCFINRMPVEDREVVKGLIQRAFA